MSEEVGAMKAVVFGASRLRREMALRTHILFLAVMIAGGLSMVSDRAPSAGEIDVQLALGAEDAPVTIVEYFSFSCPHCAHFHRENFPRLQRDYIDGGKVRFVFRDFPLNLAALTAARLTHCVAPERYFEIVDLFWQTWDDWIDEPDPTQTLLKHLRGAGLDEAALDRCENDTSLEERVLRSYLEGSRDHGVDRTPTFLINNRKYVGMTSYARLTAILDSLLDN